MERFDVRLVSSSTSASSTSSTSGGSVWVPVPVSGATCVWASPQGLVFYDPTLVQSVFDYGEDNVECKFKAACSKSDCSFAHPFPCKYGASCRSLASVGRTSSGSSGSNSSSSSGSSKCKFQHPDLSSVVPLGQTYPLNQACKFGPGCTNKTCHFAHPLGRGARAARVLRTVRATHMPDLTPLPGGPSSLNLGMEGLLVGPGASNGDDDDDDSHNESSSGSSSGDGGDGGDGGDAAHHHGAQRPTQFQFHGEFVFFFSPHAGPWASDYFRSCRVHRFDPSSGCYHPVVSSAPVPGHYELAGHYCNAAVGCGNYFALSWWPFEDEALRALWEAARDARARAKMENAQAKVQSAQAARIVELERSVAEQERLSAQQKVELDQARHVQAALSDRNSQLEQQVARVARQAQAAQKQLLHIQKQREWEAQAAQKKLLQSQKQREWEAHAAQKQLLQNQKQREWKARQQKVQAWEAHKQQRDTRRQRELTRKELARQQRWRLRDPIHLYCLLAAPSAPPAPGTLASASSGAWHLVLDYHKGAHALQLLPGSGDSDGDPSDGQLLVTENDTVFEFEVVVDRQALLRGSKGGEWTPCVPGHLCDGF
jgi:hypothetical protein